MIIDLNIDIALFSFVPLFCHIDFYEFYLIRKDTNTCSKTESVIRNGALYPQEPLKLGCKVVQKSTGNLCLLPAHFEQSLDCE